ncbi:MAG TPA: hypothetical protein VI306_07285 [Pyrinomonadaceae bacterium]
METALAVIDEHPQIFELDYLQQEMAIGWTAEDARELEESLDPYLRWIHKFLNSGEDFPTHIENSGSLAVPIGNTTTPDDLFATLGEGVTFSVREYDEFWITVHYPNPEPVVTLLPKTLPGAPDKVLELCARCSDALGATVGGFDGMFLAWLLPGFSWAMHTDHDNAYEKIATRVHVPIFTSPQSLYVWGRKRAGLEDEWLVTSHLPAGKIYHVRVDVPHTVVNEHDTLPRLHLILDVKPSSTR